MNYILETINHPAEAFERKNKMAAWTIVGITVLLNAIFEGILRYIYKTSAFDFGQMTKIFVFAIIMYLVICTELWIVCKLFGSKLTLTDHLISWGDTFAPNAICTIVVAITEIFFELFWNGTLWGMLLSFIFGGILLWKAILYCIYLRSYAKLCGWCFIGAGVLFGIIIMCMAVLNGYLGVKTPMI